MKAKKRYGQNFLINDTIAEKIVETVSSISSDLIVEIGPGQGAITKKLKKYNSNILAFEIDKDMSSYLTALEDRKTKVIYGDFLELDIVSIISSVPHDNLFFVSNLPYYITTPILDKIIEANLGEKSLTIMVQKEVGERFLAQPNCREYGYMTVLLNYWYDIKKVVDVPRTDFFPAPNVDSMVIKLIKKRHIKIDYENFKNTIKMAFRFKRKTIANNLKECNFVIIETILKKHGYSLQNRPENIDLDTYIEISQQIIFPTNK